MADVDRPDAGMSAGVLRILSGSANPGLELLLLDATLDLRRVLVTDTVAPRDAGTAIEVCSIAPALAQAIACLHGDKPLPQPHAAPR